MVVTEQHAVDLGIHPDFVKSAQASGFSVALLLQLVMQYGLPILCLLAAMYKWPIPAGLCTTPVPPLPPTP